MALDRYVPVTCGFWIQFLHLAEISVFAFDSILNRRLVWQLALDLICDVEI